jgi:protein gp37
VSPQTRGEHASENTSQNRLTDVADLVRQRRPISRAESALGAELTGRLAWRLLTLCNATFVQRRFLSLEPLLARWPSLDPAGIEWAIVRAGRVGRTIAAGVGLVRDTRDRCGDR